MNVLIVEDEPLAAERLLSLLQKTKEPHTLLGIFESIEETVNFFREGNTADVMFLDIELADGKSFDIFKKVPITVPVIFTTAYDQYALQAFKVFSIDYLLKPIELEDLKNALGKLKKIIHQPALLDQLSQLNEWMAKEKQKPKERLLIKSGNKLFYKPVEEVAYFLAEGKEVYLFTQKENKKYLIDYTLEELENQLNDQQFFRISRKAIVNVDSISEVKGLVSTRLEVKLTQPSPYDLTISRDRSAAFKNWLDR